MQFLLSHLHVIFHARLFSFLYSYTSHNCTTACKSKDCQREHLGNEKRRKWEEMEMTKIAPQRYLSTIIKWVE